MNKVRFSVPVECKIPFSDLTKQYYDDGVIMFPESYTENGKATRLVINCHGAGGTVTTDDAQIEHSTTTKYLLANGFAVMDVNGLPLLFSEEYSVDIRNNIGSPIAVDSYVAAYHYCMDNFNLKKEVFVHGGSMGGISSTNLVLSQRIPVIAQTGFCPVLDTYRQIFLRPWSGGLPKTALSVMYSFDKDENGEWKYDENKVMGYNPINSNQPHPCPLLFCHCINDTTVDPEMTKEYIARAKQSNIEAKLLLLPDGGHEPQDYGEDVANPSGKTILDGEQLSIKVAVEEVYLWISKFDSLL